MDSEQLIILLVLVLVVFYFYFPSMNKLNEKFINTPNMPNAPNMVNAPNMANMPMAKPNMVNAPNTANAPNMDKPNMPKNANYKWITQGTCASNKMQDLTQEDCSSYLADSNYTITPAKHGPPGCWLVLGDSLNKVLEDNPQFIGKGFGCHSLNKTDGMQCSPDFPCVCK